MILNKYIKAGLNKRFSDSNYRIINDSGYTIALPMKKYASGGRRAMISGNHFSSFNRFIRRNWRTIFTLFIALIDTASLVLSSLFGYSIRMFSSNTVDVDTSTYAFITFYYWIILISFGLVLGLYRRTYQSNRTQQYKCAAKVYLYSLPAIFSLFYFLKMTDIPRSYVVIFVSLLPLLFIAGRYISHKLKFYLQEKGLGIRNTLIYGDCRDIMKVFERILLYPELGYNIKGFVLNNDNGYDSEAHHILQETLPEYTLSNIGNIIRTENIECILTPNLKSNGNDFFTILNRCKKGNIKFKLISDEYEDLLRFAYVKDIAGIPLYSPPRVKIEFIKISTKRIFDIIGSTIAIILLSPVFLMISIAILIEDGWPIFFRQKRALVKGIGEFYFYKFRSMVKDAEIKQTDMYKGNKTGGGLFLVDNDPRVTKVGKFIRKYSLDEIPQFFNVLKGDMSLVGPRPLSIADLNNISTENSLGGFYQLRLNSKPGITGLWQISGRREVGFREMVLLDLYYIENRSILFDLEIMFETVPVVFFGKGAY